jgi:hypothetical protein
MICPKCNQDTIPNKEALTCDFHHPAKCSGCDHYFWVRRVFSKLLTFLFIYSAAIFFIVVFSFLHSIFAGVTALLASVGIFWGVLKMETLWFGLKECTNEKVLTRVRKSAKKKY